MCINVSSWTLVQALSTLLIKKTTLSAWIYHLLVYYQVEVLLITSLIRPIYIMGKYPSLGNTLVLNWICNRTCNYSVFGSIKHISLRLFRFLKSPCLFHLLDWMCRKKDNLGFKRGEVGRVSKVQVSLISTKISLSYRQTLSWEWEKVEVKCREHIATQHNMKSIVGPY